MEDALGNWWWLADIPNAQSALVLVESENACAFALADPFAARTRVVVSPGWRADLPPAAFDCVAVPDAAVLFAADIGADRVLGAIKRSLRPETGIYVGIESVQRTDGARVPTAGVAAWFRAQRRLLRRAGFRDVREYYLVQSPADPRHIVPNTRAALTAWDRSVSPPSWRATTRRFLYRVGLTSAVLRYRLVIGRV
jgi:hypothetical protein